MAGDGSGAGSRKWRGAAAFQLFAPTHMGCFLLYHLYALSEFFLSKLIDSLERWHPREAFILAKRNILAKRQVLAKRYILAKPPSGPREVSAPLKWCQA